MQGHIAEKNIRSGPLCIYRSFIANYILNKAFLPVFFSYLAIHIIHRAYYTQTIAPLRGAQ